MDDNDGGEGEGKSNQRGEEGRAHTSQQRRVKKLTKEAAEESQDKSISLSLNTRYSGVPPLFPGPAQECVLCLVQYSTPGQITED